MQLDLAQIRIDGGTQPRSRIDENIVSDYAGAMACGAVFPPVVIFYDGVDNWLADGFHRYHATRKNEQLQIAVETHTGTKRDAILYSVSANAAHGLRRTNEDKRRAVLILMNDPEWAQWSNAEIGRRCGVSHELANVVRNQLADSARCPTRTFVHHESGKQTTMKTGKIGFKDSLGRDQVLREGFATTEIRRSQIAELAAKGNRSEQIAEAIGVSVGHVKTIAGQHGIKLPEGAIGRSPRINHRKVMEETVLGLEASAASIRTVGISLDGITKEEALDWAKSLSESLRLFSSLRKKLQDHANA